MRKRGSRPHPMGLHIPQGGQSRMINLRGGDRYIRNVSFTYRRPGDFDVPATVELWGSGNREA